MKVAALKDAIMLCRRAGVTPFIMGHRGTGKSEVVKQTATEHQMGYSDFRLSQCEASDLRGLPYADIEAKITRYLPPADLPHGGITWKDYMGALHLEEALAKGFTAQQAAEIVKADPTIIENPYDVIAALRMNKKFEIADPLVRLVADLNTQLNEGILFLDELNRAQDDVIQACFQLVLEGRVGSYVLPTGWSMVAAGNFTEGYMTNGFTDAAFINRFSHLTLDGGEMTLEEWVDYMTDRYKGAAAGVIEFASQNPKHLDGDIKGERGFAVQPSRRTWASVVRVEQAYAEGGYSEDAHQAVIAGLVGHELAIAYIRYSCPVRPKDLIEQGIEHNRSKLATLNRNQMTGLMLGVASFLKGKMDEDKKAKVALDFARFLAKESKDKDTAVCFCNIMVGGSNLKARAAMVSNPAVVRLIGKFRGPDVKKTFADRLLEDPVLQNIVSRCAWGKGDDEK